MIQTRKQYREMMLIQSHFNAVSQIEKRFCTGCRDKKAGCNRNPAKCKKEQYKEYFNA